MLKYTKVFSGFSVNNLAEAKSFYSDTLGVTVKDEGDMGFWLHFKSGSKHFVYPKDDHRPATFTVLNFPVDDIDMAVDELRAKGVNFELYDNLPARQDERGILRGLDAGMGPDIAWFKDPAGNVLSILQESRG